jgi:flagellar biogenesis protein FliO
MSLGQQRQIYTIEMNGKILLVGSTPSQINLIKEFDCINDVNTAISGDNSNSASEIIKQEEKSVDIDELFKKYKN